MKNKPVSPHMTLPAPVIYVMDRLEEAGYTAYAVGGCVRDHLLGRTPGDYDVTTSAKPEEILKVFAGDRVVETGLQHGTVTVVRDGMNIETTTYRIDGTYDDGRHPDSVTFTDRLEDDLSRRDFTVNAMAYNPRRGIADCWNGREDMENRIIRCVGSATDRFSEDGLRVLRALRFASVLDFTLDGECAAGVRSTYPMLAKVSRERIYVELTKLLRGVGASGILRDYGDIIAFVLPGVTEEQLRCAAQRIGKDEALVAAGHPTDDAIRYALLLAETEDGAAGGAISSLKPSREEKNAVLSLLEGRREGVPHTEYDIKARMGRYGDKFPLRLARFACLTGDISGEAMEEIGRIAGEIQAKDLCRRVSQLAVDGRDLMAMGLRGREIGDTLAGLLSRVMAGELNNEKEALLAGAKEEL